MVCFRHRYVLMIARRRMLIVKVKAVLLDTLMRRLHHDGLHVVSVTHERHLLRIYWLFLC